MPKRTAKFLLVCVLLTSLSILGLAQSVASISGRIVEEGSDAPIAGAFVSILHENKVISYSFSDKDGNFTISCKDPKSDKISVTILGYAPVNQTVGNAKYLLIKLHEAPLSLKAAKVSGSPIKEKGDTISFAAGAFREEGDLTAADLLKKLPGIVVTPSGGITYNGEYINKFYVDGLDLMGNRYGVVTQNLSSDKIAKVEVYRKHQPIKALQGISPTNKSAVNIVLKEDAKNSWLLNGDLLFGAPEFPLFEARSMLTRFAKESQSLFLLKGNNVGKDVTLELQEQAYFGKTGVFRIIPGSFDEDFRSKLNPQRTILSLPKEYWYDNLSGIASFNHLQKLRGDLQIRTSLQAAAEKYNEESYTQEDVIFADGSGLSIKDGRLMNEKKSYLSAKVSVENNSKEKYISNDLSVSGQRVENTSFSEGGNQNYNQSYTLPSFKIENNFKSVVRRSSGRAVNLSSDTEFVLNNHSASFEVGGTLSNQALRGIDVRSTNTVSDAFSFKKLRVEPFAGMDFDYMNRRSVLSSEADTEAEIVGNLSLFHLSPNAGVKMRGNFGGNRLYLLFPAAFNYLLVRSGKDFSYFTLSPSFSLTRSLGQNFETALSADYKRSKSNPEALLPAAVMQTYRTIELPSYELTTTDRVSASASLKYSNNPAMFYANLALNFSFSGSDMTSSHSYSDAYTLLSYIPSSLEYTSYGAGVNLSKYFGVKILVADFSARYEQYSSGEYLQNQYLDYNGEQTDLSLSLRSSALKWLSAEASVDYTLSRIRGSDSAGQNRIESSARLSIIPTQRLSFYADLTHLYIRNLSSSFASSNVPLLKCGGTLKAGKFSLYAECRNLLNIKELKNETINSHGSVSHNYTLRGREFICGVRMSF